MGDLLATQRVLVVEDEYLVLMLMEDMLADLGCESVTAAATIEQALDLIADQKFDAALLDMNLNGESPYAVADALAESRVPFIFATGYVGNDLRPGYRDRPLLRKPFRSADLADALARLVTPLDAAAPDN